MVEYLYIPIILLLYVRTWKYNYLIDDSVPRGGYLLDLGDKQPHYTFYDKRRPILATVTNIGTLLATCLAIHHLFGWKAALLFAVFPLTVDGTAWITGNYYMSTVLLVLVTHLFALKGIIGTIFAIPFYVAALGSTVAAIPYAFIGLITGQWYHAAFLIPLLTYLFGYRFRTGLKLRKDRHVDVKIKAGTFNWRVIFLMPKVVAYYAIVSLFPSRMGFWHDFTRYEGHRAELGKPTRFFWLSLTLLVVFFFWGWTYNKEGILWWFLMISVFSQFTTFGMLWATRYSFLANVGFCMVASSFLTNEAFWILTTLWFCKSWQYIKVWKDNKTLFLEAVDAHPNAVENYLNLSAHYAERKRYIKALEVLKAALLIDKNNSGIHDNLSDLYFKAGYFSQARYHLQEALKTCSQSRRKALLKWLDIIDRRIAEVQAKRKTLRDLGIFKEQKEEFK